MTATMEYKGYQGSVEPDMEEGVLFGKVLHITDTLAYHAATVKELEKVFRATVDAYLKVCAKRGMEPKKPLSGSVTVRIGEDLQRKAVMDAMRRGESLNQWLTRAVAGRLGEKPQSPPRGRPPLGGAKTRDVSRHPAKTGGRGK